MWTMKRVRALSWLAGMTLLFAAGTAAAETQHDNVLKISAYSDSRAATQVRSLNFVWDNRYAVTSGQPWQGVSVAGAGGTNLNIVAKSGRQNSQPPAQFFAANARVSFETGLSGGSPNQLNFAFTGTLYINGTGYPVVFGQGHSGTSNNWWVGMSGEWQRATDCGVTVPGVGILLPDRKFLVCAPSLPPAANPTGGMVTMGGALSSNEFYVVPYTAPAR